jgi:hypothetical protein
VNMEADLLEKNQGCAALLEACHLNLYRENTFRVTGLPVDSSEKDIKRHAEKLKLSEEMGFAPEYLMAYALNPQPSVDQIRQALGRLKDPEKRLVDEFFWFWPLEFGKSADDPNIQSQLRGDADAAFQGWMNLENDDRHGYIATHNLAVLFHLLALDWSHFHIESEVDEDRQEKIKSYWKESFKRWEKIVEDDKIWETLKSRVASLDDPRLKSGFVRRMRDTLPEALDKINAEIALDFALQGRNEWARTHVQFMRETNQGLDDVEKTANLVLAPTKKRVIQFVESAKASVAKRPEGGAEIAQDLLNQSSPLKFLFDMFHGADSHHGSELFDEVSLTIVNCIISYQKQTNDNKSFVDILQKTMPLATSLEVRQRIQKNIDIGQGNLHGEKFQHIYDQLKKVQESKEKSSKKLHEIKKVFLRQLLLSAKSDGCENEGYYTLSDSIAIVLRGISTEAHNNENDLKTASEAISLAVNLVYDQELKKQFIEDEQYIKEKTGTATCFYCSSKQGNPSRSIKIPLHFVTSRRSDGISYNKMEISVPRCNVCWKEHLSSWGIVAWASVLGMLLGGFFAPWSATVGAFIGSLLLLYVIRSVIVGCLAAAPLPAVIGIGVLVFSTFGLLDTAEAKFLSLNMLGGGATLAGLALLVQKFRKDKKSPYELALGFPRVGSLILKGWQLGKKP